MVPVILLLSSLSLVSATWQDLDEYVEVAVEKKYRLRDRSRLVKEARYSPPKEEERQRVQCVLTPPSLLSPNLYHIFMTLSG